MDQDVPNIPSYVEVVGPLCLPTFAAADDVIAPSQDAVV